MAFPTVQDCAAAADRLAPAALGAAAGSVVILGLAGVAALALRRASAAARHEVWLLGFAGVLLLPVLSAVLPGWHVLPRWGANGQAPRIADAVEEVVASPFPASPLPPARPERENVTAPDAKADLPRSEPPRAASEPAAPAQQTPPHLPAAKPGPARAARSGGPPWVAWALLCWPVGSLLVLGRVLLGHLSLWALRRRCAVVRGGEWFDLLERLRGEIGLRRRVELLFSPARAMPMTWGLWRARLLVTENAAAWPPGQRRDVLLHELGHVGRWDCLTQFLSRVACAVYWFNLLAWVADRRMQVERERACDDLVLSRGADPPAYARHLLQSVSSVPAPRLAGAAVAMARPSTLEERMRAILNPRLNRRGLSAGGTLAAIILFLSALVPVAALKAQQAPADRPPANGGPVRPPRGGGDGPAGLPATRPASTPPGFGGGRTGGRGGFGGGAAAPALGDGPTCTIDATVYDVRLPPDQIGRLDVDALAQAADTAEAFEKALAALGTAKPMYRANQSVRLAGDSITIGSQVPVVTNSRMTDKGQAINTIQYQSVGAIFTVAGKAGGPGGAVLDLGIEVSATSDGGAAVSETVKAPVMRRATLSHKGPFQPRRPFVVVSVDASSADKDGKAVAYIARIMMGDPQLSADARRVDQGAEGAAPGGADVLEMVLLHNTKAAETAKKLHDLVGDPGLDVTADDRTNALLLRGTLARVSKAKTALNELDRPAASPEVQRADRKPTE